MQMKKNEQEINSELSRMKQEINNEKKNLSLLKLDLNINIWKLDESSKAIIELHQNLENQIELQNKIERKIQENQKQIKSVDYKLLQIKQRISSTQNELQMITLYLSRLKNYTNEQYQSIQYKIAEFTEILRKSQSEKSQLDSFASLTHYSISEQNKKLNESIQIKNQIENQINQIRSINYLYQARIKQIQKEIEEKNKTIEEKKNLIVLMEEKANKIAIDTILKEIDLKVEILEKNYKLICYHLINLLNLEEKHNPKNFNHYKNKELKIYRAKIISEISELCFSLGFLQETFFTSINCLDSFISKNQKTNSWKPSLLAITCVLIAAKFQEDYPIKILKLIQGKNILEISVRQIKQMERTILDSINFSINRVTLNSFVLVYLSRARLFQYYLEYKMNQKINDFSKIMENIKQEETNESSNQFQNAFLCKNIKNNDSSTNINMIQNLKPNGHSLIQSKTNFDFKQNSKILLENPMKIYNDMIRLINIAIIDSDSCQFSSSVIASSTLLLFCPQILHISLITGYSSQQLEKCKNWISQFIPFITTTLDEMIEIEEKERYENYRFLHLYNIFTSEFTSKYCEKYL
ncbi:cyclin [Anaeramoeba ignava]|uniref:Cyclin n=1 Tax=Anaeramoeba ignava TaxID=1746090 RepID=A0A9Q0L9L8_ANAIG|nr:cyclin [Anaeramoeba ignava]